MPRQSRIDAPGALHHIIARGIGHRHTFNDNMDSDAPKGLLTRTFLCNTITGITN